MDKSVETGAAPFLEINRAQPNAILERRENGEMILRSGYELGDCESNVTNYLRRWAKEAPERTWLAQRGKDGAWETVTYGAAMAQVNALSQALLDRGFDQTTPVMILSGNSIAHALLTFAAMQVGVPAAPIAVAYSTMGGALKKLHHVVNLLEPKMIFAETGSMFQGAFDALSLDGVEVVCREDPPGGVQATLFSDLAGTTPTDAVDAAHAQTGPDTVGKYLFTSGSTGMPKAVPQTQRMMCANQKASSILFPPDPETPPVIVDWLPWNHCYGGNSNVFGLLREGGTMYIDDGRPIPGQFDATIRNLREIAPTKYLNVAAGHAMLAHELEADAALRKHFFSRLTALAYGDAVKFVDEADHQAGLSFDGRVVEDFKLLSGTFVSVGTLRNEINSACAPAITDCVIAGHDRDFIGILAWPDVKGCKTVAGIEGDASIEELVANPKVIAHIEAGLRQHNLDRPGSSTRVSRVHLLLEPPSQDAGEITEKGYVNQRAVLEGRADRVKALYEEPPGDGILTIGK